MFFRAQAQARSFTLSHSVVGAVALLIFGTFVFGFFFPISCNAYSYKSLIHFFITPLSQPTFSQLMLLFLLENRGKLLSFFPCFCSVWCCYCRCYPLLAFKINTIKIYFMVFDYLDIALALPLYTYILHINVYVSRQLSFIPCISQ